MGSSDFELEQKLKEAGNLLLNPPSSIDELLPLLDEMECLLLKVDQMPPISTEDALLLPMKALVSSALCKHSNEDVKCLVASCISEIARITAPRVPYNDDQMREIFILIVAAIEKVSQISGRFYTKATSILHVLSKTRLCLLMLDLELDELVVEMFQHFLQIIRPDHPHSVFSAMTSIMTMVIDESEEISSDLLNVLLGSVKKENQGVPPIASKLAEKVITYSAAKLKPCLQKAVQSAGIPVDLYAPVVVSICQDECCGIGVDHIKGAHLKANGSSEDVTSPVDGIYILASSNGAPSTENVDDAMHDNCSKLPKPCSLTQLSEKKDVEGIAEAVIEREKEADTRNKRGWKPNFLMNPDEGYDHSWTFNGRTAAKLLRKEKQQDKGRDDSPSENPVVKRVALPTTQEGMREMIDLSPNSGEILNACSPSAAQRLGNAKKGRPRKRTDGSLKSLSSGKVASSQLEGASTLNSGGDIPTSSPSQTQRKSNGGPAKKGRPRKEKYPNSLSLSRRKVLSPKPEEGTMASDDGSLRKQTKRRENIKFMKQKYQVIIGLASKAVKKKSLALLEVKNEVLSEDEETLVLQAVKVGKQKVRSSSSVRRPKKRNAVDGSSDGNATVASGCKENVILDEVGNSQEKTPKSNVKRKRTPRKEMDLGHPNVGEELIGSRIKVWWPLDKTFYEGVVDSYDTSKKKHKILYTDGDEEILNLRKQRWELVTPGTSLDKALDSSLPKSNVSNDILLKQKRRPKLQSSKKRNYPSSAKSTGSGNDKIKSEPIDIDEPNTVDDLRNDSNKTRSDSKHDSKEADNGNKPAIKLKIKGPKPITPSEQGQSQGQKFKIIFPKAITPGVEKTEMPKGYL